MQLVFILVSGLLARLISINQSLWLDEATSALVAKMSLTDMFKKFLPGDFHPPLYYLVLKYWVSIFGSSEVALRIPSVIFGLATVYFIYLIGKKIINEKAGIIASALAATSGLLIYYSQEARMYALAAMLTSAAVYFFLKKKWLVFGIMLAILGMTDYVSLLIIPVFLVADWKNIKKVFLSFIPLVVVFAFWLPTFVRQITTGLAVAGTPWWSILGVPTIKNAALIPVKFILGRISFDNKTIYGIIVIVVISVFVYLLYQARKSAKILWAWLVIPIAFGIILSFVIPTLTYFRFLFCLPALYLLCAEGIEKAGKYKYALLAMLLIINILSAGYYLFNPKFHREDWRAAANALGSDKIVFPGRVHEEALVYYGKGDQIISVNDIEPTDNVIWLSRYVWEISDSTDSTRLKIQSLGYTKAGEYNFNGVVFWKYIKNTYAYRY